MAKLKVVKELKQKFDCFSKKALKKKRKWRGQDYHYN